MENYRRKWTDNDFDWSDFGDEQIVEEVED